MIYEWCCKVCGNNKFTIVAENNVAYAECLGCDGRFHLQAFVPPQAVSGEKFVTQLDRENIIISCGDKLICRTYGGTENGSKGQSNTT